jgi:glutaminyl-tRNA synthetase
MVHKKGVLGEPSLKEALPGEPLQFERVGYFNLDKRSEGDRLIFNRAVTLRDGWK